MYRRATLCGLILLFHATCLAAHATANEVQTLRAGAAVVEITPEKFPVSMTGGFADRQATHANDPLHARALVLDNGSTRLAFVVCDSCLIDRPTFDAAKALASKATGIPTSHMLMSATHTHTAVTALDMAQRKADPAYLEFLARRIAASVEKANAQLQPAKVAWGVAQEPKEVFNRRWHVKPAAIIADPFGETNDRVRTNPPVANDGLIEPAGPTDPDVSILAVQSKDGRPLALLGNYALHYVGGIPRDALSADYFGEFAGQIKERLQTKGAGPAFVAMLSNGASGDINNINFREPRPNAPPLERLREVAANVADAALKAYGTAEFQTALPLAVVERKIMLGVRKPSREQLERARMTLASSDGEKANLVRDVYAQEQIALNEFPAEVEVKLQAIRVGDLGIVAIPCEAFCQIGLDIKRQSPLRHTFTIGLANGYHGYLPTPEQHALGGYETWRCRWSYLDANASRVITTTAVEMLNEVAEKVQQSK